MELKIDKQFIDEAVQKAVEELKENNIWIPDGMTNGEVIQALFPYVKKYESTEYHNILFAPSCHLECCNEDWWNAPYQKGGEE